MINVSISNDLHTELDNNVEFSKFLALSRIAEICDFTKIANPWIVSNFSKELSHAVKEIRAANSLERVRSLMEELEQSSKSVEGLW